MATNGPIQPDEIIRADHFIQDQDRNATPASDEGKTPVLEDNAKISTSFLSGMMLSDESDGDLTITSGTTTIDLGGAKVVILQYGEISITGTGSLGFSNPSANGTTVIILCKKITVTSSADPAIDLRLMGAAPGAARTSAVSINGIEGTEAHGFTVYDHNAGGGSTGGSTGPQGSAGSLTLTAYNPNRLLNIFSGLLDMIAPGAGGGSGGMAVVGAGTRVSGGGGRGGGSLAILCSGDWNVTSNINLSGQNGENAPGPTFDDADSVHAGGGGGGGSFFAMWRNLIADSGTVSVAGGIGGNALRDRSTSYWGVGAGGGSSAVESGAAGGTHSGSLTTPKVGGDGGDGIVIKPS